MKHLKTFESFDTTNEELNFPGLRNKEEKEAKLNKEKEEALKTIMSHPVKKKLHLDLEKNHPDRVDKHISFIIKNPSIKYYTWDDKKQDFVPTGIYSVASGEGLSGK